MSVSSSYHAKGSTRKPFNYYPSDGPAQGPRKVGGHLGQLPKQRKLHTCRPKAFAGKRIADFEALIEGRYLGPCETDDGELLWRLVLPSLMEVGDDSFCQAW